MNIDRDAADADDRNLRLFKQWGELSFHNKQRLTAALRDAPRYKMVEIEDKRKVRCSMDQGHLCSASSYQQ